MQRSLASDHAGQGHGEPSTKGMFLEAKHSHCSSPHDRSAPRAAAPDTLSPAPHSASHSLAGDLMWDILSTYSRLHFPTSLISTNKEEKDIPWCREVQIALRRKLKQPQDLCIITRQDPPQLIASSLEKQPQTFTFFQRRWVNSVVTLAQCSYVVIDLQDTHQQNPSDHELE